MTDDPYDYGRYSGYDGYDRSRQAGEGSSSYPGQDGYQHGEISNYQQDFSRYAGAASQNFGEYPVEASYDSIPQQGNSSANANTDNPTRTFAQAGLDAFLSGEPVRLGSGPNGAPTLSPADVPLPAPTGSPYSSSPHSSDFGTSGVPLPDPTGSSVYSFSVDPAVLAQPLPAPTGSSLYSYSVDPAVLAVPVPDSGSLSSFTSNQVLTGGDLGAGSSRSTSPIGDVMINMEMGRNTSRTNIEVTEANGARRGLTSAEAGLLALAIGGAIEAAGRGGVKPFVVAAGVAVTAVPDVLEGAKRMAREYQNWRNGEQVNWTRAINGASRALAYSAGAAVPFQIASAYVPGAGAPGQVSFDQDRLRRAYIPAATAAASAAVSFLTELADRSQPRAGDPNAAGLESQHGHRGRRNREQQDDNHSRRGRQQRAPSPGR